MLSVLFTLLLTFIEVLTGCPMFKFDVPLHIALFAKPLAAHSTGIGPRSSVGSHVDFHFGRHREGFTAHWARISSSRQRSSRVYSPSCDPFGRESMNGQELQEINFVRQECSRW